MRFFSGMLSALLTAAMLTQFSAAATPPTVNSETYVVMDVKTGQVLAQKGAHTQMFPASITKILTCALALEKGSPQDIHTMSYEATHSIGYGTTHIALTENEQVAVEDLLNATMIESANDAANGLAEYVAGSLDGFAELMNQKTAELGATDSHFTNAHGLHAKNHYTSAYDMALITRWALTVDGFRTLFGAEEYTIAPTNKQPKSRYFGTHHHMLVDSKYYYEGTEGGKLGWTPEAKHTLVTLAKRGDMELICVVMKTTTQYEKYIDTAKLFDYAFENFATATMTIAQYTTPIAVYDGDDQTGEVVIPTQDIDIIRPPTIAKIDITSELVAPERYNAGDTIAPTVRFLDAQGTLLAEMPLKWQLNAVASAGVDAAPTFADDANTTVAGSSIYRLLWAALGIIALAIAVLMAIRWHNLRILERKRLVRARKQQERQRLQALMEIGASQPARRAASGALMRRRTR